MTIQKYQTSYGIENILIDDPEVFSHVNLHKSQVYDLNGTLAVTEKDCNKPGLMILTMIGKEEEEINRHISRLEKEIKLEKIN